MAWIESHQALRFHPKTTRLARRLGVSVPAAVGHLHCLWWWAMDYAPDGDLDAVDAEEIAIAAGWEGAPEEFIEAAVKAGFIDNGACLSIHDWQEYAGKLIERKDRNRERMRQARAEAVQGTCDARAAHEARTCSARGPTIPNLPTKPLTPLADASAPAVVDNAPTDDFEEWWATYGRIGSKADAERLYRFWRSKGAERADLLDAARAYRDHCGRTDCKMQHARTFLAKPQKGMRARWYEWAEGEEHGSMDARSDARLNDVLTAGAAAFGLTTGASDERTHDIDERPDRACAGGAPARRGLPAGSLARRE